MATSDTPAAIGTQAAQPTAGSVTLDAGHMLLQYPHFRLTFTLDGARVPVTDATTSGSFGALKLFDFIGGAISIDGTRQNYTAFAEGAALTGEAGDAVFDIGIGSVAKAAAADGALTSTDDNIGDEIAVTLSGGTGTGSGIFKPTAILDGTSTPIDLVLNISGTAATIDATSSIDVTGTVTVTGTFVS